MKKNAGYIIMAGILFLTACRGTPSLTQTTPNHTVDSSSATPSPLPTNTSLSIETPTVSITALPTIPTFTPTFDVRTIVTVTPSSKAECPPISPNLEYDKQNLEGSASDMHQQFIDYTLSFLNRGGAISSIRAQFMNSEGMIIKEDVTGDGVDELISAYGIWIDVFGCNNGFFQLLSVLTIEAAQNTKIIDVTDVNLDGLADIVVYFDACLGWRCPSIQIVEWDGVMFKDLIADYSRCRSLAAPVEVEVKDVDKNGTKEIVLSNDGKPWPDGIGFPYRKESLICMWNGQNIVLFRSEFGSPHYRYQSIQDGDAAVLMGNHDEALGSYQQAIFDEKLEWLTQERSIYDFWIYHAQYFSFLAEPTPTASPSLQPDPAEYPSLAAYAYYRMMLIHLVQANRSEAGTTYSTLQKIFGSDEYGRPYVEMATVFWEAYQSTHKMYDGCAAAIQYAAKNPEILIPLGSDYHGSQSHTYIPADVCPFR